MSTSPHSLTTANVNSDRPTRKRVKRSYVACRRCHAHKVKCSGEEPCRRCRNTQNAASCEYPARDRKIAVAESYLKRLEANSRNAVSSEDSPGPNPADTPSAPVAAETRTNQDVSAELDITNPLKGSANLLEQQFIGESTCTVFASRLLQSLHPEEISVSTPREQYHVDRPEFTRRMADPQAFKLPDRIRANLLVRVALRFIGQDYHLFLHKEFLHQLERVYLFKDAQDADPIWTCKFFVVLALGELYSGTLPIGSGTVPGTDYFTNAVLLQQDMFEEPKLSQIEIMLLFCFYSNALGRIKSAHVYSGLALRFGTCLGLHRQQHECTSLTPIESEHRIRLWWTAYIFDRSLTSRLGQPLTIQDEDIDVRLPSSDHLSVEERDQISAPGHLNANIELARIEGSIMRDIYSPSSAARGNFLHNVRTILKSLRNWDANAAPSLRWKQGGSHRPVASLQLHFNQCIILTTRPVLLYVLEARNPFSRPESAIGTSESDNVSGTAKMLADSCISAARTSNSILSQLYVENALAIFGHFDAHYLFASTLVLIISAIMSPNSGDSDAVQTSFQLLKIMRDSGNVSAAQFYSRLLQIQTSVGHLRARATARTESIPVHASNNHSSAQLLEPPELQLAENSNFETYDWGDYAVTDPSFTNYDWTGFGRVIVDPLDNPMLQTFLDHADVTWEQNMNSASIIPN